MRLFGAVILCLLTLWILGFIPSIVHFFINIGIIPDQLRFREGFYYQFWAIVALGILLYIGFLIVSAGVFLFFLAVEWHYKWKVKQAKKKSKAKYGFEFLYFTFLDKKYQDQFYLERESYPRRVCHYYEMTHGLDGLKKAKNENEYVKEKFPKYQKELGLPEKV